jgi:beta-galactosidase
MLKITDNKFLIGKEVYPPLSVELSYFRVSKRHWSICFERIKRAGIRILSTYVPWNLHETAQGQFDFGGHLDARRDLIVFLELAREFGFKVILKPGPWIGSEWANGGYPDYLASMPDLLARDPNGNYVPSKNTGGVKGGYVPTYLHPAFLSHLKRYYVALAEVVKHYIYPRGPVFLVEIDSRPSFGGHMGPFDLDYNQYVVSSLYPEFLQQKFEEPKKAAEAYAERAKQFADLRPPAAFHPATPKQLAKVFDWMRFKEWMMGRYVSTLREILVNSEMPALYYFTHFSKEGSMPLAEFPWPEDLSFFSGYYLDGSFDYYTAKHDLKAFVGTKPFAYLSTLATGLPAALPEEAAKYLPYDARNVKFSLCLALASGIKGFNLGSFVERDHWYGSPLTKDGTVTAGYEVIRKFAAASERVGFDTLESSAEVAFLVDRPLYWYRELRAEEPYGYILPLMNTYFGLVRDFSFLKFEFGVADFSSPASLKKFKTYVVPTAEVMSRAAQEALVEMLKQGKKLVFFGAVPVLDESGRPCQILSSFIKVKTAAAPDVGSVKGLGLEFPASLFGHIRKANLKKIAYDARRRPVGAAGKVKKGEVWFFSFDLSSQLNHERLSFLEKLFDEIGIERRLYASDPHLDMALAKNQKATLLYLSYPLSGTNHSGIPRQVIIRVDTAAAGIRGEKLRLIDLLGDVDLKISSKDLRQGLPLKIAPNDSFVFLIEKK